MKAPRRDLERGGQAARRPSRVHRVCMNRSCILSHNHSILPSARVISPGTSSGAPSSRRASRRSSPPNPPCPPHGSRSTRSPASAAVACRPSLSGCPPHGACQPSGGLSAGRDEPVDSVRVVETHTQSGWWMTRSPGAATTATCASVSRQYGRDSSISSSGRRAPDLSGGIGGSVALRFESQLEARHSCWVRPAAATPRACGQMGSGAIPAATVLSQTLIRHGGL